MSTCILRLLTTTLLDVNVCKLNVTRVFDIVIDTTINDVWALFPHHCLSGITIANAFAINANRVVFQGRTVQTAADWGTFIVTTTTISLHKVIALSMVFAAELDAILDERELESLRMGYRERVTDTHLPQIAELPDVLPDLFAGAAVRAKEAGFDGVELHYAHAYTMSSLLSRLNTRDDGYGGPLENRLRLPLEVFSVVRSAVGDDYTVGCRYLADDIVDGGNTVEDAAEIGVAFANAGMNFISLSRGGRFEDAQQPSVGAAAYPYTGPSGYECMPQYYSDEQGPFGRNFEPAANIRNAIRSAGQDTPVVVTGGVHGFQQAEEILSNDKGDIVGFARQALADPDWFLKVRLGRGDENVVCEYTNYCEALDQKHVPVTCKLWDRLNMDENGILKTPDGKRRLTAPVWEPDLDIDDAISG